MSDSGTPSSSLRRAVPSDETGNDLDHNQRLIFPDSDLNELEECIETDHPSHGYTEIPFTRIYELVPNKHEACNCFIPGTAFSVEVTDVERFGSSRRTEKTCRYTVRISHGPFEWAIKRRYKHFHQLHQELQRYRALLHLQRPARRLKEHRLSMRRERKVNAEDKTSRPPQLPARIDSSQQDNTPANVETNLSSRKKHVENYLQTLLRIPVYRDHPSTLEFLEVSRLSFINKLGPKGIEGNVNKRSGGYTMQRCCGNICFLWSKRYLVLKDSFMLYMKQDEGRISSVLLFDRHFNVHMADPTEVHGGIVIENMSRTLTVKCASYRQALWWLKSVQEFVETHKSPYLQENRFGSFAPPRDAIPVKWYVNAAEYFLDVAYALESAQEEIFITDWWLSPEIYLKRPPVEGNYWRLDYVLKRRAVMNDDEAEKFKRFNLFQWLNLEIGEKLSQLHKMLNASCRTQTQHLHPLHMEEAGVRVYVLLYKEVELALGINSGYSKHTLMNAHENIKVIRHPDHVASTVFFWAHHEKLVVIDQTLAFLGGIDLAYGRWDDHQHRLTDVGSVAQRISPQQEASPSQEASPTQEASPSQEASPTQEASPSQETTSQDPLNSPSNSEQMHSQDESVTGNTDLTDGATSEVEPDSVPRISAVGAQGWSRLRKVYHTQESVLRDSTSDQQDAAGDRVDGKDASSTLEGIVHRWRNVLRQKLHREDPQKNNLNKHKMDIWEDYGTVRPSSVELFGEARFWHGKDYCNCVFKDWVQLDKPLDDFIDRHVTPRMPWHDIGVAVQGGTARDVARHFIQRWNFAWTEKKKKSIMTFPKLLPKSLSVPTRPSVQLKGFLKANVQDNSLGIVPTTVLSLLGSNSDEIGLSLKNLLFWCSAGKGVLRLGVCHTSNRDAKLYILRLNPGRGHEISKRVARRCAVLLRSASDWSAGIKEPEKSIHDAYIDTINNSKHFIYIENQFFVSCADDKTIFNGIGDAITNRIIKAYREKQHFRVYVVVPLLPGFEGDLTTGGGNAIQAVMHFNYRTICRGKYSIVERLKVEMDDMWVQFISFCSLRTHAELGGRPITELIYVHSKMLIADDRTVIIGSANINDRSMLGRRDSELAVVVSDTEFVPSTMDGQPYEAGKFAGSLRNNCFRLILGLLDQPNVDISDVVSEHFFKDIWTVTAGRNATIFDKVFKCIPSDFILNSEQLACKDTHDALVEQDGDKARQKLKGVQGFLVQFPLLFLQEQNLMPAIHTKEGIMPTELWT